MSSWEDIGGQCDMKMPVWGFLAEDLVEFVPNALKGLEGTLRKAGIDKCVVVCHVGPLPMVVMK
ncbi:MAG: hypothetical protein CME04_17015 [Gemmatimonadaceae bacterium]|nr:hypothetical protein [Gemmatimonadaceae bacterium]